MKIYSINQPLQVVGHRRPTQLDNELMAYSLPKIVLKPKKLNSKTVIIGKTKITIFTNIK